MATTVVNRYFIDTNILMFAALLAHPKCAAARAALAELEATGVEVWTSRQVFREYLAAMTRPTTYTGSTPMVDLIADVQDFEQSYHVAEDGAPVTVRHLQLISTIPVAGKTVHDANLVATALEYGVGNILTDNVADFKRFDHLINVIPLIP